MKRKKLYGFLSLSLIMLFSILFTSMAVQASEVDPEDPADFTDPVLNDQTGTHSNLAAYSVSDDSLDPLDPVLYLQVVIEDMDEENNAILTPVAGADLTLSGGDLETRMSTTEENLTLDISPLLVSDQKYLIDMNNAPTGYIPAQPVEFTTDGGEIILFGEYDETSALFNVKDNRLQLLLKPLYLNILKTDEEGESLEGAVFALVNERETEVYTWTSGQNSQELGSYLDAGSTYTIREISPPEGYVAAAAFTFTINRDGTIEISEDADEAIILLPKHDQIQVKNEKEPSTPEEPEIPEEPKKPETPEEPEIPDEPKTPEEPEEPEIPEEPTKPEKPVTPQKPSTPSSEPTEVPTAAAAVSFYSRMLILSSLSGLAIALVAGKRH